MTEKPENWSALAIQQMLVNLRISPLKMDASTGTAYLVLTEQDTAIFVNFLNELKVAEFLSSQSEILIPLCLPDTIVEQFIKIDESETKKVLRHTAEYQNKLLFFLQDMFGFRMLTGLRTSMLKKTFKIRKGNEEKVCIDCFNKAEADYLKENLESYGFSVETAKCDACCLVVDLNNSHISKVSKLVIEFCNQFNEAGMTELSTNVRNNYISLRVPAES